MIGTLNICMYYNKIATKRKNFICTSKFQFLEATRKKKASTKGQEFYNFYVIITT